MFKKHKSGSLKRKEQEKRKNLVALCVPLTNFSNSQPSVISAAASSHHGRTTESVSMGCSAISMQVCNDAAAAADDDDDDVGRHDEINEDREGSNDDSDDDNDCIEDDEDNDGIQDCELIMQASPPSTPPYSY